MINRISLDTSNVRAASISALGIISLQEPSLSSHISNILSLFQDDKDDEEVRHRSTYFKQILEENASSEKVESQSENPESSEDNILEIDHLDGLISQLDEMMTEGVFDMESVNLFSMNQIKKKTKKTILTRNERIQQKHKKKEVSNEKSTQGTRTGDEKVNSFLKNKLGNDIQDCIFSSDYEKLSEEDFEYFVKARKHVFKQLVVVEFLISNNSENQIQKVQIKLGK